MCRALITPLVSPPVYLTNFSNSFSCCHQTSLIRSFSVIILLLCTSLILTLGHYDDKSTQLSHHILSPTSWRKERKMKWIQIYSATLEKKESIYFVTTIIKAGYTYKSPNYSGVMCIIDFLFSYSQMLMLCASTENLRMRFSILLNAP